MCVGFVMCECYGNMCTCFYCGLYCLYCVFCNVSFMYIYSYLFCLYHCKNYCHRVKTQLPLVIIIIIIIINILPYPYAPNQAAYLHATIGHVSIL